MRIQFALILTILSSCRGDSSENDKSVDLKNENSVVEIDNKEVPYYSDSTQAKNKQIIQAQTNENMLITEKGLLTSDWAEKNTNHPVFYSRQVDVLVNKNQAEPDPGYLVDNYIHDYIGEKKLKQLTVRELIYYCLAYPASYSQNCGMGYPEDKSSTPKIYGYISSGGRGAGVLSVLQKMQLEKNRDSVIFIINDFIRKNTSKIEDDYLYFLLVLKSFESIPLIIQTASMINRMNYSFLLLLMEKNEYSPFRKSKIYASLYGEKEWEYGSLIEANTENISLIIKLAKDFYKEQKK